MREGERGKWRKEGREEDLKLKDPFAEERVLLDLRP